MPQLALISRGTGMRRAGNACSLTAASAAIASVVVEKTTINLRERGSILNFQELIRLELDGLDIVHIADAANSEFFF